MDKKIIDLILIALVAVLLYFIFTLNAYSVLVLLLGILIGYILIEYSKLKISKNVAPSVLFALTGGGLAYLFQTNILFVTAFLLGTNLINYYIQIRSQNSYTAEVSILNTTLLSGVVLLSGITKFRGFNKLAMPNIDMTIPILILIFTATFFLLQAIKSAFPQPFKKYKLHVLFTTTILTSIFHYLLSYFIYKEVGTGIIFVPLIAGLCASLIGIIDTKNTGISELLQMFLILVYPYTTSGLLGIILALLSTYLFSNLISVILTKKRNFDINTALKVAPVIFILAIAEIRENEGQITRFNLITGYQLGWIFVSAIIFNNLYKYINKIKRVLDENEIIKLFSATVTVFTIFALTLIIRFGRHEALSSLVLVSSLYLFFLSFVDLEKHKQKFLYIFSLGNFIGALAFLVLTRL